MSDATITRGPATAVGLSSVYSAAVAYITLLLAARMLSPEDNATFLVYWAVLFGAYGIVTGVSPEAARASYRSAGQASVLGVALGYGAIIAVVIAGSSPLWAQRVLHDNAALVFVAAAACLAYTGHLAVWGVVTGRRRWAAVAGLMIAESTARLVLVAVAFWVLNSLAGLAVAAALPALTWVVALAVPTFGQAAQQRSDVAALGLLRNYGVASLASSASALLMVGFPILISATSTRAELSVSAGLILGISLTRAPLLVPLTALQGVALTHFLRNRDKGWRALLGTAGPLIGVTAAGAGLAFVIGPWLFTFLLGGGYRLDGRSLAALTVSAGLLACLTLTGMFALALHRHGLYAAGWLTATGSAIVLLLAPLSISDRVLLSLVFGPLLGVLVHAAGLAREVKPPNAEPAANSS